MLFLPYIGCEEEEEGCPSLEEWRDISSRVFSCFGKQFKQLVSDNSIRWKIGH